VLYQKENNMNDVEIYRDFGIVDITQLERFEKEINYFLPLKYKKLIAKHDGLRTKKCDFDFINIHYNKDTWSYLLINSIDTRSFHFFCYGESISKSKKIYHNLFNIYGHDGVIAFGGTDGGDYVCFDYRHDPATDEPKIVLMFHDAYDDVTNKMLICPVADSFEAFMDSLYEYKDEE
jgi:cell wall assembly regulator SMI1